MNATTDAQPGPGPRDSSAADGADVSDAYDDTEPDDELDDVEETGVVDRWAGTEHERAGGARRGFGWLLVIGGALGTLAAAMLMIDYLNILQDPNYSPGCDINPMIGCGQFLGSEQSHAFGFPNVIIGMVAFPVVVTTGVVLLAGVRLPRWYWRGFLAGTVFGIAFVTWLQVQAVTVFGALCPWCALVWTMMIPIFVQTVARTMVNGALPAPAGLRAFVVPNRTLLVVLWYLVLVAVIIVTLWDGWLALL
jgi:uncharacterized membrane protein